MSVTKILAMEYLLSQTRDRLGQVDERTVAESRNAAQVQFAQFWQMLCNQIDGLVRDTRM